MKMNKKGILIGVFSLVILYFVICIIFVIPKGIKYSKTVFLGSDTKVSIKNNSINVYNEANKYLKQAIKIYFKNEFIDGYIYTSQDDSKDIFITNKNGDRLSIYSTIIAHTPDVSIKIKESETKESDNIEDVYNFANSNNIAITDETELDYLRIDSIDIDDDKSNEEIYSVGLINYEVEHSDEEETKEDVVINKSYISFVYMKKSDKYILIDKIESEGEPASFIQLSFAKLIDFDNDDNYEFVIERMMSAYGPYYYDLYNYGNNKFTKIGGE